MLALAASEFVLVAGARPNFMKLAPLVRELTRRRPGSATVVHTGQHRGYEMSGVFFEQLGMPQPDVLLDIGSPGDGDQAVRIMRAFDAYLVARAALPRAVVVVGDVTSTMACAVAAARCGVPVAHVEAGLRSFDLTMPEEVNRIVTDSVSEILLVSEPAALDNLARERVPADRVRFCGNVMIDSLLDQLPAARALEMPARFGVRPGAYVIATLHRPSNVDVPARLRQLVTLLQRLGNELPVLFPVHPRTERMLGEMGLCDALVRGGGARLLPPLGYREFVGLLESARLVVTDSGGVQDETTFLGFSCVTLRESTERPITVSAGTNQLAGDDLDHALHVCTSRLRAPTSRARPIDGWDGHAAARIVDALDARFSLAAMTGVSRLSRKSTADHNFPLRIEMELRRTQ